MNLGAAEQDKSPRSVRIRHEFHPCLRWEKRARLAVSCLCLSHLLADSVFVHVGRVEWEEWLTSRRLERRKVYLRPGGLELPNWLNLRLRL